MSSYVHPAQRTSLDDVLDAIVELTDRHGYAPSIKELCAATGVASSSTMANKLAALEERGDIRRVPGQARTIVIVREP